MLILDIGSCHEGKKELALAAINEAKNAGADAIKFQLFPSDESSDNIPLDADWLPQLVHVGAEVGIEVFASVFCAHFVGIVKASGCEHIKIAYSQRGNDKLVDAAIEAFGSTNTFISYGAMEIPRPNVRALYVHTINGRVVYPVDYYLSFGALFRDGRFCGFSDHTLGYMQAVTAACSGAVVIEKHVKFPTTPLSIPDARFAITFEEACALVNLIKAKGKL